MRLFFYPVFFQIDRFFVDRFLDRPLGWMDYGYFQIKYIYTFRPFPNSNKKHFIFFYHRPVDRLTDVATTTTISIHSNETETDGSPTCSVVPTPTTQ